MLADYRRTVNVIMVTIVVYVGMLVLYRRVLVGVTVALGDV